MFIKVRDNFEKNTNYIGIDLIKFICAYLICALHTLSVDGTSPLDNLGFYVKSGICRIAVPFYFATAAFLLYRKKNGNQPLENDSIKKTSFKLFRLWGTWAFLLVFGGQIHLWYLGAAALSIAIMNILLKRVKSLRVIGVLCCALYVVGLLGDSYRGFLSPILNRLPFQLPTTRNAIFMGLMFVFIGVIVSRYQFKLSLHLAVAGLIVSIIFLYIEVFLLKTFSNPFDYNICIAHIPITFFLLYIAVNMKIKSNENTGVFRKLRVYGVLIYFTQMMMGTLIDWVFVGIISVTGIDMRSIKIVFVFISVTVLAIIIEALSHKKYLTWLRYLYS